jgi:hypothetical protein
MKSDRVASFHHGLQPFFFLMETIPCWDQRNPERAQRFSEEPFHEFVQATLRAWRYAADDEQNPDGVHRMVSDFLDVLRLTAAPTGRVILFFPCPI